MDWTDEAFVLSARRHGETSVVVQLLTGAHGRHAGRMRGGAGAKSRALIEAGNLVAASWRARLSDQLGNFRIELLRANAARLIERPGPLAALVSAATLLVETLPEREPHPLAYAAFAALIESLDASPDWPAAYVRWELALLAEIGYGLDLSSCAATGATDELVFVSPKSAHAVSRTGAQGYESRLLPLPEFLLRPATADAAAIRAGLALTGHFLALQVFAPAERALPAARARLLSVIGRE